MIPAKQLLSEIVNSLREVIAPAIAEPYPKSQAYMAAVILEFVSRQVEERSDVPEGKHAAIVALFENFSRLAGAKEIASGSAPSEAALSELIERLYAERQNLGEESFAAANRV